MFLNCHTYFSLRYGTLSPDKLLELAAQYGVQRLALTDINTTSAILEVVRKAAARQITIIPGIEFRNGHRHLFTGIAQNEKGFAALNRFLSQHLNDGTPLPEIAPAIPDTYIIYPYTNKPHFRLRQNEYIGIRAHQLNRLHTDHALTGNRPTRAKLVAWQPVTFGSSKDLNAHRILRAIDNNTLLSKLDPRELASPDETFLSWTEQQDRYHDHPYLLLQARDLLEQCSFGFEYHTNKNKLYFTGSAQGDADMLIEKTFEGVHERYGKVDKTIHDRINKELEIIIQKGFVSYFLINRDIVAYARSKGYFTIGRGSGANSLIAYCLHITDVDPIDLDLYFERFINLFRETPPDFDLDFSWTDRDDVTRYIFERYGHEHTALLATYSEFKERAFIREVAKTFGLPKEEIDSLIKSYGEKADKVQGPIPDKFARSIYKYGAYIHHFPNLLSIHASGILISELPIYNYTATWMPPKGYPTTQFDMYVAEDIGLYKFDILSQRGLGHIKDAVAIIRQNKGEEADITQVSQFKTDPVINERLSTGNTIGCFYIESPAMRMLLKKLQVKDYLTLVAASSIIRPGVARSGMMREYIVRHRFPKEREKMHPVLGKIMPDTYGVMVYQEDVIKVAHYFAGLTLSEADVLRRGMSGKYRSREEFQRIRDKYFENCREKRYDDALVKDVWHQIESFAGYSFAKGHSASYAVESYQSLYLKTYYPIEFMVGVINNFGGFYSTELYVHEARMSGATIAAPCINKSYRHTVVYDTTIYLGFQHIQSLEQPIPARITAAREQGGPFESLEDFLQRVAISLEQLEILILVDAFRSTGVSKQELLVAAYMQLHKTKKTAPSLQLFPPEDRPDYHFPQLHHSRLQDAWDQIQHLGFPLISPFELLPADALQQPYVRAKDLPDHKGKTVEVLGYYVTRKVTYTIKGEVMYFGTFLDSNGDWIDTVHFPDVARQYRFRGKACYRIRGKVTEEYGTYSIAVSNMEIVHMLTIQT